MKKKISLIIFDCDGVLIDSEILAAQVELTELQKLGYPLTLESYLSISLGKRTDEVEEILVKEFGIPLPRIFWQDTLIHLRAAFNESLQPIKGIQEALSRISTAKCVASNSPFERLKHSLEVTELIPYFKNYIFHGGLVDKGKPFPDLFLLAAKTMNAPPQECVVIEDSEAGVIAAQRAGMDVCGFVGGSHIRNNYAKKLQNAGAALIFEKMELLPDLLQQF